MKHLIKLFGFVMLALMAPISAWAHCDSVAGPVAKDVRQALDSGSVAPVLKWVRPADEPEVRTTFERAMAVRKTGGEPAELADQFFLETVVRLHRASEGEPFTGLKPKNAAEEAVPASVDAALKADAFDGLGNSILADLRAELARRIEALKQAHKRKDADAEHGREFVRAYVGVVHYLDALDKMASAKAEHAHEHAGE